MAKPKKAAKLKLTDLKEKFDEGYAHGTITREQGADDLIFAVVTQWDDNLLGETQLQFKGEFNILRKAIRHILAELRANPVQVDFDPVDQDRKDGADLLDGLYRGDDRRNTSIEAYNTAAQEAVICGVGAWYLYTEYVTTRGGDTSQVIRRKPIYEANNKCFWDPNARLQDKADAKWVAVLHTFSQPAYADLVEELTGEEFHGDFESFKFPQQSYVFPWVSQDAHVYVVDFYERTEVTDTLYTMVDSLDNEVVVSAMDLGDEHIEELIALGYTVEEEKEVSRHIVTKYIASGDEILKEEVIAGEYIPVIPMYGERQFVEEEEYYEGITRLAKDPQRLRNFMLSYLADLVSRSPRAKPIFAAEQIQGYEDMYAETGSENNYPYLLQNLVTLNGEQLPVGPVSMMPNAEIPPALMMGIEQSRIAVEDVADPGLPKDFAAIDISTKSLNALMDRIDQQSVVYQQNIKHAKRRDGEVYASIAAEVYSNPRTVMLQQADGTRKSAQVMEQIIDKNTGEMVTINDLRNIQFDVYADVGQTYQSQKEASIDNLKEMSANLPEGDETKAVMTLTLASLVEGDAFKPVRQFARKKMVTTGLAEPQNAEEEAWVQEASEQQQAPDPMLELAQAEKMKGEAQMVDAETKRMAAETNAKKIQIDGQTSQQEAQIKAFDSQTKRLQVQVAAEEAGAKLNLQQGEIMQRNIDNRSKMEIEREKVRASLRARAS